MPTQSPLVLLWFFLLVAWLSAVIVQPDVRWLHTHGLAICTLAVVLSVAYAGSHIVLAHGALSVPARAARAERPLFTGTYPAEDGPAGEFRWTRDEAHFYTPVTTRYTYLTVGAQHPDIARQPVRLVVSTPCATVVDVQLTSQSAVTIALQVPPTQPTLHTIVRVSRTWQPSAFGGQDQRHLGATVAIESTNSADLWATAQRRVVLTPCLL
jgi:hypothetical protein